MSEGRSKLTTSVGTVLRHDLRASIVVFLIAVPLSLGIAAASGAPLIAGLIAAVVGGVVVGAFSGAPLQVSGPAAGLTVTVAALISQFGWAATAAICALAGVVQIILGLSRLGRAALTLSPAVVHGMLAGIGAIIVLSQLHVVLGGHAQSSTWANIRELPAQIAGHHDHTVLIGIATIVVLLGWARIPRLRAVPATLVAIVLASGLAAVLGWDVSRVDLPDAPLAGLEMPSLPKGSWSSIVVAVFTVAIIASVESMLSAVAIDKMHDRKRADLDRELVAQGIGNTVSGLLGGLPVTGVIVRSSANVAAGARTRASAMLHGAWIAAFVLVGAGMLELIPTAALSAILVVIGVRLVDLGHVRALWRHHEILPYVVTVVGVVALNLLEGVLLGLAAALAGALYRLIHHTVALEDCGSNCWRVKVRGTLMFLTVSRLVGKLQELPAKKRITLELHIDFLDHAAFEAIRDWITEYDRGGGEVTVEELHGSWYRLADADRPDKQKSLPRLLEGGDVHAAQTGDDSRPFESGNVIPVYRNPDADRDRSQPLAGARTDAGD